MVHTKSLNQLGRPRPTRAVRGKTIATARPPPPPLPLSLHLAACRSRLSVNRTLSQDGGGGAQA